MVNTDRQTDKYLYWPYTRISLYVNNASAKFQHLLNDMWEFKNQQVQLKAN